MIHSESSACLALPSPQGPWGRGLCWFLPGPEWKSRGPFYFGFEPHSYLCTQDKLTLVSLYKGGGGMLPLSLSPLFEFHVVLSKPWVVVPVPGTDRHHLLCTRGQAGELLSSATSKRKGEREEHSAPPGNQETICKAEFNKQCQQDHNDHIYGRTRRPELGFSLSCVQM